MRRVSLMLSLIALALGGGGTQAASPEQAKAWPTKPVRVVVGFGAGGVADVLGRYVCEKLAKYNGQAFVIDNRPVPAAISARVSSPGPIPMAINCCLRRAACCR